MENGEWGMMIQSLQASFIILHSPFSILLSFPGRRRQRQDIGHGRAIRLVGARAALIAPAVRPLQVDALGQNAKTAIVPAPGAFRRIAGFAAPGRSAANELAAIAPGVRAPGVRRHTLGI